LLFPRAAIGRFRQGEFYLMLNRVTRLGNEQWDALLPNARSLFCAV
jgi:hypothetical protein